VHRIQSERPLTGVLNQVAFVLIRRDGETVKRGESSFGRGGRCFERKLTSNASSYKAVLGEGLHVCDACMQAIRQCSSAARHSAGPGIPCSVPLPGIMHVRRVKNVRRVSARATSGRRGPRGDGTGTQHAPPRRHCRLSLRVAVLCKRTARQW
jgi:hypothetical protein